MHETFQPIGFEDFASYPVHTTYDGAVIENEWFEERLNTHRELSAQDIEERTGIRSRGVAAPKETVTSMALQSLKRYIEERNLNRNKCKHLFLATSAITHDILGYESTLMNVHDRIQRTAESVANAVGISSATGRNIACTGACAIAVDAGKRMHALQSDEDYFLAVTSEKLSAMTDLSDPNTGFLFGDMVAVWRISRSARMRLLHAFYGADLVPDRIFLDEKPVEALDFYRGRDLKRCIRMPDGRKVMIEASDLMVQAVANSLDWLRLRSKREQCGREIAVEDISAVWMHEANRRFAIKKQGKPGTMNIAWRNAFQTEPPHMDIDVSTSGNNGSSSWPRRMHERNEVIAAMPPGTVITSPLAGASENMNSRGYSYGNMLFEIKDD